MDSPSLLNPLFEYNGETHEHFEELGCCTIPDFLSEEGLSLLREKVDKIWEGVGSEWHEDEKEWLMNLHQQLPGNLASAQH